MSTFLNAYIKSPLTGLQAMHGGRSLPIELRTCKPGRPWVVLYMFLASYRTGYYQTIHQFRYHSNYMGHSSTLCARVLSDFAARAFANKSPQRHTFQHLSKLLDLPNTVYPWVAVAGCTSESAPFSLLSPWILPQGFCLWERACALEV